MATLRERFFSKIEVDTNTFCWNWTGGIAGKGYGYIWNDGKVCIAHRISYELFVGPIPEGMQIDHFWCDNKICVNPLHIKPSTSQNNVLRSPNSASAINARKTHCPKGHPYDRLRKGGRECSICVKEYDRNRKRKRKR